MWEHWMVEFPEGVLKVISEAWEGLHLDIDGNRVVSILELKWILSRVLDRESEEDLDVVIGWQNFLPGLVVDSEGEDASTVSVPMLPDFLKVVFAAVSHIEHSHMELLWKEEDAFRVETAMQQYKQSNGRMSMDHLFHIVQDLGFSQLDVKTVDNQQRLVDFLRIALETMAQNPSNVGTLALEEVLFLVTLALREADRRQRRETLKAEAQVRAMCGFTRVEMEVLREMYRSYLSASLKDNVCHTRKDTVAWLVKLLRECGVRPLKPQEARQLEEVIEKHEPEVEEGKEDSEQHVDFCHFVLWMHDIFTAQIGDLTQDGLSPEAFEAENGFVAAMLHATEWMDQSKLKPDAVSSVQSERLPPPGAAPKLRARKGSKEPCAAQDPKHRSGRDSSRNHHWSPQYPNRGSVPRRASDYHSLRSGGANARFKGAASVVASRLLGLGHQHSGGIANVKRQLARQHSGASFDDGTHGGTSKGSHRFIKQKSNGSLNESNASSGRQSSKGRLAHQHGLGTFSSGGSNSSTPPDRDGLLASALDDDMNEEATGPRWGKYSSDGVVLVNSKERQERLRSLYKSIQEEYHPDEIQE